MKSSPDSLRHQMASFLPELEPGELDAAWINVEPYLPRRKRRAIIWLPFAGGIAALLVLAAWFYNSTPEFEPATELQSQSENPPATQPFERDNPSANSKDPGPSAPATGGISTAHRERRPARKAPAKALVNVQPAEKQPEPSATHEPVVEKLPEPLVETTIPAEFQEFTVDQLVSKSLVITSEEKNFVPPPVTMILQPVPWRSRLSVTALAGPMRMHNWYSTGNQGKLGGWHAGLAISHGIGRRWLADVTVLAAGSGKLYFETSEYYEVIPTLITTISNPYGALGYRKVVDSVFVHQETGWSVQAAGGYAVLARPRLSLNLLVGGGVSKMPYAHSITTTVLPDTLFSLPSQYVQNTARFNLSNKADDVKTAVQNWFVSPQVHLMYRIGRRTALVSRVSAQLPLAKNNLRNTMESLDATHAPTYNQGTPDPERHRFLMVSFGINFRL